MAAILTHYLIGEKFIEKYKNFNEDDLISFLVGTIAVDAPNSQGKGFEEREKSHFGSSPSMALLNHGNFDLEGDVLDYDSFLEKYGNQLDNPFVEGYLLHLYTDKKWFKEIITELLNTHASTINGTAKTAHDLSFKEAIAWYTKNLYSTYEIHDILFTPFLNLQHIEKMSNYNVENCPIEEINKQDLKSMLEQLKIKCENLKNSDPIEKPSILIPLDTMLSFIDDCAMEAHQLYSNSK